jgi:hypothetical protein
VPDLDVTKAGGATGALQRATQLANIRAANAARTAQLLANRRAHAQGLPYPGYNKTTYSSGAYRGLTPQQVDRAMPRPKPPPRKPVSVSRHPADHDLLGLGQYGDTPPGLGNDRGGSHYFDTYMRDLDQETREDTTTVRLIDPKTGKPSVPLPGQSALPVVTGDYLNRDPAELERFTKLSRKQRDEVRANVKATSGPDSKYMRTVNHMIDLIKKDPLQDSQRFIAGQDLADAFRDVAKSKYFTNDDLIDNPLLGALNDLSVWSDFRIRVRDFNDSKKKTGQTNTTDDTGDGSFGEMVDNGSFSAATSPGNLSKWIVARDEHGLLEVVSADQWIQAKYARMRHDPKYAAQMITALAATSAYGSDSTANSQRTRLVIGKDGMPVKGFPSKEDLSALKWLANEVAILQNQGDEVAIDDSIAELTKTAFDVTAQEAKNGDLGGGGGYGGYGGGGGYGYGGGGYGGGGGQGVRYTDGTQLTSLVSSIARQRMGRELTPDEAAAFVKYYHGLEETNTAAYYAGQSNTQLDPEGQAVAWITSHFADQAAQEQYGDLAANFFAMMGGENPFSGIGGS